jgi:general nucleoside transport system permease protein
MHLRDVLRGSLTPIVAFFVALAVGALILLAANFNPLLAYLAMYQGAFADFRSFTEVLLDATPLICIGAGLAVAFRCGVWNIGGEGQFYAGAVVGTAIGIYLQMLPGWLLLPLMLAGGVLGGGLWAMLAGWLKARFRANEVVTTVMLNYVAIIGTGYLVSGPMIEPGGRYPQTVQISLAARLPQFLPPTRLNIGFIIALLLAAGLYLLIFRSSTGFAIRAVGTNPEAARYAGIKVNRNIILAMAISGGAAGLGGAMQIAGVTYRLFQQISPGFGFTAIAVSLLVNNNPLGVILAGILFGGLSTGSRLMQMNVGVPSVLVNILQGLVVLSVVAFGAYRTLTLEREE